MSMFNSCHQKPVLTAPYSVDCSNSDCESGLNLLNVISVRAYNSVVWLFYVFSTLYTAIVTTRNGTSQVCVSLCEVILQ